MLTKSRINYHSYNEKPKGGLIRKEFAMFNPVEMVGKAVTKKVSKMDLASVGKFAAGGLMIVGGLIVLTMGKVNYDDVNEAINGAKEAVKNVEPEVVEVAAEVVENVAETATE